MDAEEFCVRWNNHHHVLVSVLDKLLEKESMCDVTLAADHQFVRVHRLVLCACSNYFEEMLSKQVDKQAFIFLKDVSFPDLRALVDYMYKGEVNVAQEQLASFLQTAEALDIKGLAYKEGDQSKFKSGQNARTNAAKRTLSESTSTPSVVSTPSNSQRPENDNISHTPSQNQSSSRPKPPPPKKAHVVPSESPTHPANTDSDYDHFVVDTKMESELDSDHMEDQLDNNGPEWASRDCDDDWSTSDNGMISIVPNSTRDITFGPSTSDTRMGDNVAGPSGTQPKANNSSSGAASRGFTHSKQMGNCVSSQSQQAVVEKQAATGRGRSIVSLRKAAMEKYPVPTKNRLVLGNEGTTGGLSNNSSCSNNAPAGTQQTNDAGNNDITQLRSKLRPPSVIIARPVSIQLTNKSGIDTNGNIPRPSSLPRLLKTSDNNATAKIESLQQQQQAKPSNLTGCATFRTVSLDSKNRTILNPPPVVSASSNKTSTASKDSRSVSPSPSSMSIASSFGSNKSHSVADSGIATCSSSRSQSTISERKSALSLKFGFFTKKTAGATETKKANVDRINSANSILTATPPPSSAVSKLRGTCELPRQTKSPRPTSLRLSSSVTVGSAGVQRVTGRIQQPATHKSPARMPTPQLTSIKNRAALVLGRSKSSDYKSVELRPRLSVEAIVASLEQEIRHQLGPEPPPLALSPKKEVKEISTPAEKVEVERFGIETASKAQIEFVDEDEDEDFIEDIELQLQTPSSAAECQPSPEGDDQSRDEGHHGDEEDSNATSISDAMIDDEIADQPGLVMLGQSYSVPASPMHSWRSELFHYNLPPMSMINYPPSEDDQSDVSSYHHRLVRRRVASVSDIDDGLKESPVAAATASSSSPVAPADGIRASTMRAELFNSPSSKHRESSSTSYWPPSEATIVIELEEYTSMANELADIKSQLITLQNLLVETVADGGSNCGGIDPPGSHTAPLWDLKRDLVLLREELQEKNTTIKTLKNQLRAVNGRTSVNKNKESTATTKASASCNVATQTDRPRSGAFTNGLSPSDNDEVQLVSSTKLKLPTVSGLPVRSRPIRLTTK